MSTKDFKEGMVAGAKPFGDKLDQLATVSESALTDIKEGVEGVNAVVNVVLDDLSAQEKKRIYDLDEATGISSLEDDEKAFLVAVLAELANIVPNVTEYQRHYILSVCNTAGISAPQTSLNLACIENIENMRTQKIILRHVMEFFFIGTQNYDFLENYEDVLFCYFGVNRRGVNEIIEAINRIYNAMGIEGLANRYTFSADYREVEYEQISEDYDIDTAEYVPSPEEFEEVTLSGVISVQEALTYKHKNLTIEAAIAVNSELRLDSCTILLDEASSFRVVGTLIFENCEIVCRGNHTKDNYAISSVEGGAIVFQNCVIREAQYLLKADGDVTLNQCSLMDCFCFLSTTTYSTEYSVQLTDISISFAPERLEETTFETKELEEYGWSPYYFQEKTMFLVDNCKNFEVHNLKTSIPCQKGRLLSLFNICAFEGIVENAEIEHSLISVTRPMRQSSVRESVIRANGIEQSLIRQSTVFCEYHQIDRCNFEKMKDNFVQTGGVINCTFNGISCKNQNFIKTTATISNCIFANANLGNGKYLVEANISYGLGDKKQEVFIKNCQFINCCTDRADRKLATGTQTRSGLFSDKKTPYEIQYVGCNGLSEIKGGEFVEQEVNTVEQTSMGAKIAAQIGAALSIINK